MSGRNPFAMESNGFTPFDDSNNGYPNVGEGFPSLGELPSRPRRRIMVRNLPADAQYEIRILDKQHKLGITAVVETIANIKNTKFALCRTRDRPAAIIDEFEFPIDPDMQDMAQLIRRANRSLRRKGIQLLWTAHTLTVRGVERPDTAYMSWPRPYNERVALKQQQQQQHTHALGDEVNPEDVVEDVGDEEEDEEDRDRKEQDRVDAAFFADVADEDYANDAGEGLEKQMMILEKEMLCEIAYKRGKYRVMTYQEPIALLAQWMDDGTWRLLKGIEAELVEDAIAYQQLQQNVEVELVE